MVRAVLVLHGLFYYRPGANMDERITGEYNNNNDNKYAHLGTQFLFQPIAVESMEPMHESARVFLVELGRKIAARSGDDREGSFLFQRISVLLHRFNSVLLHDIFVSVYCPV